MPNVGPAFGNFDLYNTGYAVAATAVIAGQIAVSAFGPGLVQCGSLGAKLMTAWEIVDAVGAIATAGKNALDGNFGVMDIIGLAGGAISINGLRGMNCFTADMFYVIGPSMAAPPLVAAMMIPPEPDAEPDAELDAGFVWLIAAAGLLVGAVWVTKDRRWKLDPSLRLDCDREDQRFPMRKVYARVFAGPLPVEPEFLTPEVPAPSTSGLPSAAVVPRRPSIPAEERIGRRAASLHTAPRARSWPRWLIAFLLLCGAAFCGLQASLPQRMNSLLLAVTAQQPALERHVDTPPEITGLRFVSVDEFAADEDDEWLGDDDDDRTVVSASGWRMKSVADFEPGDTILAFNHATGKPEQRTVVRKFERTSDHLRLLDVKSPDGQTQTIKTTDEHPFWRIGSGKYVLAGKLRLGDQFRSPSGTPLTVIGTTREPHPEGVPVYNVEVEGHHNYFVAASRDAQPLLAHNTCKVGDLLDMAEKSDGRKAWVKYQNGAENAVKNRAPALSYDNSGYGGRNYVKFDGYRTNKAGNVTHMIDRKMNVMFTEKAIRQANKQSAALAQNSLKGIWEVPDEAAKNAAERLLRDNGIGNITVNVVPQ